MEGKEYFSLRDFLGGPFLFLIILLAQLFFPTQRLPIQSTWFRDPEPPSGCVMEGSGLPLKAEADRSLWVWRTKFRGRDTVSGRSFGAMGNHGLLVFTGNQLIPGFLR